MRKIYQKMLVLVALLLSVASVSAGERIPLTAEGFYSYEGYGLTAVKGDPFPAAYIIGVADGCPFGDSSCEARLDLGAYSKLYVSMEGCDADGNPNGSNPRIFINRTENNGQFNSDKAQSKCIVIPNDGTWAADYYTQEADGTYVIDLLKINKEFGFVHLAAIKGSAYNTKVILNSIEVEKASPAQQIGWVPMVNNSDLEGDDVTSFFAKEAPSTDVVSATIEEGIGYNGTRGIVVRAGEMKQYAWDSQFWIRFNEPLAAGTKYRVSFDYRADTPAKASTQAHAEPSDYIHWAMLGDVEFETDWKSFSSEGEVSAEQSTDAKQFLSIAFNLNELADANNYYFDNIVFEIYKAGITAEYGSDVVKVDFGFDTNIAELVKASGMPRLLYPNDLASVKVDGELLDITTVEAFPDGRFYIFTEDQVDGDEVIVSLKNPTDPAYHLIYTSGPGGDVPNFQILAEENEDVALAEDAYSYAYVKPTLLFADPEDGSFNLPNDIKEFKLTFDKVVDCAQIQATLNKEKLTVAPAEGFAKDITLTRTGAGNLSTGSYTIKVTKIFCEQPLDDNDFSEYVYTINVGKVDADPNDVPMEILSVEPFANTAGGGIPEGYLVVFNGEERTADGGTYGSGPRMMDFGEGGDFTKGLYFREGRVDYGTMEGFELTLEANKKYRIHFNSAMWKDNGSSMTFQVLDPSDESIEYLNETISNTPNVNGSYAAVDGSTVTDIDFVPAAAGNYMLRWSVGGFNEVLIANVSVKYIPSTVGVEETQMLTEALENAKTVRDGNAEERYAGPAFDALKAAIDKYEAEGFSYTAPSKYKAAAAELNADAQALKDHRKNCDSYDEQMKMVIDAVRQNGENKFNATELYGQLKEINDKYHGSSEWVAYDPEDPDMGGEFTYTFDKLTDDAALAAAIDELSAVAKASSYMFTEGESKTSSDVGIKVLVDRIRQGVEGLKQLGVAEDDDLIVRANNAVSDDDDLVEEIKNRIKVEYYGKMKDGVNLFPESMDETTEEIITPTYNFTVFVKNPNTYAWKASAGLNEENCPGWVAVEGNPGLTDAWNGSYPGDIDGLPKDLLITQYHAANRIEQTITDLPAGIYKVMIDCAEWSDEFTVSDDDDEETAAQKEANHELNRYYVKTSDTPEYVEGEEEQFKADGRIDHHGQYVARYENFLEDVDVIDGVLTIGVKWNNLAQMMFDRVQIFLAQPAAGFDYAAGYNEAITGVEAAANTAKVLSIKLFDLNGQRLGVAKKGVVIVQKQMSDGTIKTEKVIK